MREAKAYVLQATAHRVLQVEEKHGSLVFVEKYPHPLGRSTRFCLGVPLADIEPLRAELADLVARGELDLPSMGARERVAGLLAARGVAVRRYSRVAPLELGRGLRLVFHPEAPGDRIQFDDGLDDANHLRVSCRYRWLDRLNDHLAARSGGGAADVAAGDPTWRLATAFRALVTTGHLRPGESGNRDRVAALWTGAGVPVELTADRHRDLLEIQHGPDRASTLSLWISSMRDDIAFDDIAFDDIAFDDIAFDDITVGDVTVGDIMVGDVTVGVDGDHRTAGRGHTSRASTPYASLRRLVGYFEGRLGRAGAGDPEDRLFACFAELVRRGELAEAAAGVNRDRVAAWFAEAGVPCRTESQNSAED